MFRRLPRLFLRLALRLFDPFILAGLPAGNTGGGVLLLRIDNLGDYILFRETLWSLRQSLRLAGRYLILCASAALEDFAKTFDSGAFDEFLSFDMAKFQTSLRYRRAFLCKVANLGTDMALQPAFSRTYEGDLLIKASRARERIGFDGPAQNISRVLKKITDRWYSELVPALPGFPFELSIGRRFADYMQAPSNSFGPVNSELLNKQKAKLQTELRPYQGKPLFCIGAMQQAKCWPLESFVKLAEYIEKTCHTGQIWTGSYEDRKSLTDSRVKIPSSSIDLTGQLSLVELALLMSSAPFVVANDSMAGHLAVMLKVPVVIVGNGQHLGRFSPYPRKLAPFYSAVYPEYIAADVEAAIPRYYNRAVRSRRPIAGISVERVAAALSRLLREVKGHGLGR